MLKEMLFSSNLLSLAPPTRLGLQCLVGKRSRPRSQRLKKGARITRRISRQNRKRGVHVVFGLREYDGEIGGVEGMGTG